MRRALFTTASAAAAAGFCAVSVGFAVSGTTGHILPDDSRSIASRSATSSLSMLTAADEPVLAPSVLLARPVFSPSRSRRVEPVETVAAPPPPPPPRQKPLDPPSYVVGGVVVAPGIRKTLLRQEGEEAGSWLQHGESTPDGWTVAFIAPDRVVVERLGQHFDLAIPGRTKP